MKRYEKIKTEYLCYLMNRAQIEAAGDNGYFHLCSAMMECPFVPVIDMDENRCYECGELRREFADSEWGYLTYYDDDPVDILDRIYGENGTMLELFVVMAEKMKYNLEDSQYEEGTGKWFKEMLQNCGLLQSQNRQWEREGYEEYVLDILDTINYRKYGFDGEGGMFPLRWARQDQRYTELIVQMNNYIEENYDIC